MEKIGLKEAIGAVRKELNDSIQASFGEDLRFKVGEITLEFQVEVERIAEANAGIKFWVVDLSCKGSVDSTVTHKVIVPLSPVYKNGQAVLTGSSDEKPK
jgi:hypothetical protein